MVTELKCWGGLSLSNHASLCITVVVCVLTIVFMYFYCILMLHAAPIISQKQMQVNAGLYLSVLDRRQVVVLFLFYLAS